MEIKKSVVLDTDFLSYYLIQKKSAILKMEDLIENNYSPVSTAISKAEMFFGAYKKGWAEKRLKKLLELFESLHIINFTSKTSEIYGRIRAELVTIGLDIGFADTAIASITIENSSFLLTRNINHFNHIDNLNLIPFEF